MSINVSCSITVATERLGVPVSTRRSLLAICCSIVKGVGTAVVCVGKPTADYSAYVKELVREEILAEKELERERKLNVMKHEYKVRQMEKERMKKGRLRGSNLGDHVHAVVFSSEFSRMGGIF